MSEMKRVPLAALNEMLATTQSRAKKANADAKRLDARAIELVGMVKAERDAVKAELDAADALAKGAK